MDEAHIRAAADLAKQFHERRALDANEVARYLIHASVLTSQANSGSFMEIMTPIGKRLKDCTGEEVGAIGARMQEIAVIMNGRTFAEFMNEYQKA